MVVRATALVCLCYTVGALLAPPLPLRALAIRGAPRSQRIPWTSLMAPRDGSAKFSVRKADGKPPSKLKALLHRLRTSADGKLSRLASPVLNKARPLLPFIAALLAAIICTIVSSSGMPKPVELSHAQFMQTVAGNAGSISNLRISLSRYSFLLDGQPAFMRPVRAPTDLIWFLHKAGVDFHASASSAAVALLPLLFPCLWLGAVYSLMRRQMNGATASVGKKASSLHLSAEDLSFDDVAGLGAAKEEVQEIVSMLREPSRYSAAGARLPSGVLMCGPPGTGKTLLARVMAAQAEVPFFYCSGSDFVELFVGRGAARMRALFKEAAAAAPCLIFVDEERCAPNARPHPTLITIIHVCMHGAS